MNESSQPTVPTPAGPEEALAGRDFLYYWRHFRWPFVIVLVADVVLYVLSQPMLYVIFIDLVYFIYLGWLMTKRERGTQAHVITLGVTAGLVLGLTASLFKLLYFWQLYLFFNIISETLITGLIGLLISAAVYRILHRQAGIGHSIIPDRSHQRESQGTKGGGRSGP